MKASPQKSPTPSSKKNIWIGSGIAAATIAGIIGVLPAKKSGITETPLSPISRVSETKNTPVFHMQTGDMNIIVWERIKQIQQKYPVAGSLWDMIQSDPKTRVEFVSREVFIETRVSLGAKRENMEKDLATAEAVTNTIRDQSSLHDPSIDLYSEVYLGPRVMDSEEVFVQGVINEGCNILMERYLPDILEKKRRSIDQNGGIDITPVEINALSIELFKEMMSDVVSRLGSSSDKKNKIIFDREKVRLAMIDGKFDPTDPPHYAREYFVHIMSSHGFPGMGEAGEGLYQQVVQQLWKNEKNIGILCARLGITVQ